MEIPDLSEFDRYPCLSGGVQNGHLGAVCKSYRDGGGFPDGKNEIKEHITPYFGVGNTNSIVVLRNSEPTYHFMTPQSPRARDKNLVISALPLKSDVSTRSGDLKIGGVGTLISRYVDTYPTLYPDKVSLSQTIPNPQNCASPQNCATQTLGGPWGGLTLAKGTWVGGYSPKNGSPKHTRTCPKSPTCTSNTPWK